MWETNGIRKLVGTSSADYTDKTTWWCIAIAETLGFNQLLLGFELILPVPNGNVFPLIIFP